MSVAAQRETFIHHLGRLVVNQVALIGDIALLGLSLPGDLFRRWPQGRILWPVFHVIGVQSLTVILVTGGFLGMVLAVQAYDQFAIFHMENQLGAMVNVSLVKELGPVFAAMMLAGRVGSSIAAELGTMRVTEQIDALVALGSNPVRFLILPRFLACVLLIPLLTICADGMGMFCGWVVATQLFGIDNYFYWAYTRNMLTGWELFSGEFKTLFFGAAIAVISCHRGFHARAGAEGVGRAATEAFVYSFIAILALDFLLGTFLMKLYYFIW